jgi:hypothetical protein
MTDWMRIIERSQVQMRGIPGIVSAQLERVVADLDLTPTRTPAAPIELVHDTNLYLNGAGNYRARLVLDFPDVTKATDGSDAVIIGYELWARDVTESDLALTTAAAPGIAAPGLSLPGLADTPANRALEEKNIAVWALMGTVEDSAFRTDNFLPGTLWNFRVRALGQNMLPGAWSAEFTRRMDASTTPPPQPTAPKISAARGTLTVSWDGQSVAGAMPADFKYAILAHGPTSSPTAEVHRFGRTGGIWVIADIPYYTPQFVRVRAVDEAGNLGPWSEQAVGYTTPLVDADIILSSLDAAKTHLTNIDAGVSILPETIITKHLLVTEEMTGALAQFLHVKAGMLEANEIWADEAWLGLADAKLVRSDMFIGKEFFGGTFTLEGGGGGKFQTNPEDLKGIKFTESAITAWNAGAEQTFKLSASTGAVEIIGTFQVGRTAEPHTVLTANAWSIWPGLRFKTQNTMAYQPTLFAIGGDEQNWTAGDFVMMGSEQTANTSGRAQLRLGDRGSMADLSVTNTSGTRAAGLKLTKDGQVRISGSMPSVENTLDTFTRQVTAGTANSSGWYTINRTPRAFGIMYPLPVPDGLGPVTFATENITPASYRLYFANPANNITSFNILHYWVP